MVIWLHLTGGVIFPLSRNSAVFFWPPRGLPSDSRDQRHRGRPRGGCRRPWRVLHKAAGYTGHCVILLPSRHPHLDTNPVYMFNLSLKRDWNESPVEKMKWWNEKETSWLQHPRLLHQEDGGKKRGDADVVSLTILTLNQGAHKHNKLIKHFGTVCLHPTVYFIKLSVLHLKKIWMTRTNTRRGRWKRPRNTAVSGLL